MKKNLNSLDHGDHFDRLDGGRRRPAARLVRRRWRAGRRAPAGHHQARRRLQRGRPGGRLCAAAGADPGGRTRHPGHRREPARRGRLAPRAGGGGLLGPRVGAEVGTQVIVENRPGASGSLGGDAVAKAPPDGAMIYFGASPTITINPNIQRKMSFDPGKDLLPIAPLLTYTNVLVVNPELPVRNVGELLAYARANPGKLFYGSAGIGASNHMSAALLERMTGAP